MKTAICPGSYDPITFGHINILLRAAKIFDRVVVLVLQNYQKPHVFSTDDRKRIIESVLHGISGTENIIVDTYEGLFAEYAKHMNADAIIKGVRSGSDYDYERTIAAVNTSLSAPETLFMPAAPELSHVSPSTALHLYKMGADVSSYLPDEAIKALKNIGY